MYYSSQARSNSARLRYACVSNIIEQATILLAVFVLTCFANSFELGFDFELSITAYTQATTKAISATTTATSTTIQPSTWGGGKIQKSRCANNKSRTASTRFKRSEQRANVLAKTNHELRPEPAHWSGLAV